jgi:hypothetical protein
MQQFDHHIQLLFAGSKHKQKALKKGATQKLAQTSTTTNTITTTTMTTATTGTSTVNSKGTDALDC